MSTSNNTNIKSKTFERYAECLKRKWTAAVYAFFKPDPVIEYNAKGERIYAFECAAKPCRGKGGKFVHRNLSTGDASSTGNLHRHAKQCWGEEVVESASRVGSAGRARDILAAIKGKQNGSITAAFERAGKGRVTYRHRQYNESETR